MILMNDYKEAQIKHAKSHFANHRAKLKRHGEITTLDWRNENGSYEYYVHYVFDGCLLYISGDLGSAVVRLSEEATLKHLASFNSIDYFVKKIECSTNKYVFNERIAKAELLEQLFPNDEDNPELLAPDLIDDLLEYYFMSSGFEDVPSDLIEQVEELDPDYWEWFGSCGEVVDTRIFLWLVGLQMAWEQVKDHA